jgi:hypothetical protein
MAKKPTQRRQIQDGMVGMGIHRPKGQNIIVPGGGGGISAVILATQPANLLGYYKCDDASGSLVDSSGNGNDLPITGSGQTYGITGLGDLGDAVRGGGSGGWGDTSAISGGVFNATAGLTMGLVCRRGSTGGVFQETFCSCGHSALNRQYRAAYGNTTGHWFSQNAIMTPALGIIPTHANDTTTWRTFAFRFNPSSLLADVFTDGVQEVSKTMSTAIDADLDTIGICDLIISGVSAGSHHDMVLQHVYFYNTDLSDAEIIAIQDETGLT